MSTKTFSIPEIKAKLQSNPDWVEHAILAIYSGQTQSERMSGTTHDLNGVGFNGFDAEILSSFATRLLAGKHLTPKQLKIAFHKMPKYAGQLYRMTYEGTDGEKATIEYYVADGDLALNPPEEMAKHIVETLVESIDLKLHGRPEPEVGHFIVGAMGIEVQLCDGCDLITAREYVSSEVAEIKAGIVQSLIDSGASLRELLDALD